VGKGASPSPLFFQTQFKNFLRRHDQPFGGKKKPQRKLESILQLLCFAWSMKQQQDPDGSRRSLG
jgi:hypothetical protein